MKQEFDRRGYAILRSVIDRGLADFMHGYALSQAASGLTRADVQVPGAPVGYGSPLMERTLLKLVPAVEAASGRRLYPTYSFFRVYRTGDELRRHKDRPACEISLSLCLGYKAAAPWPLFVEGPAGVCAVELQKGDGLLYKGLECPHWREPFAGEIGTQVFLHYVDRNGPFADSRFDGRESLSTGSVPGFAASARGDFHHTGA